MFLLSTDYWYIKSTKEKGKGVFCKKQILAGTVVGDYLGKVIKTAEYDIKSDAKGLYLMYLTDEACIYPDLEKPGIHLFNHSCNPNCWIYIYKGHTLFFTIQTIHVDEELTISYLLSPDSSCVPCSHLCKCKSKVCTGTMHLSKETYEKWQNFQNKKKKRVQLPEYIFDQDLPKLASYPASIFIDPIYTEIYPRQTTT